MAKTKRRDAAARGTRLDPERGERVRPAAPLSKKAAKRAAREAGGASGFAPVLDAYERQTLTVFTIVEVILVAVPVILIGYVWLAGGGSLDVFQQALRDEPLLAITFVSAIVQPLVAWQLRFVRKRYSEGAGGYAAANLIGFLVGELLLMNAVGVLACGFVLMRVLRRLDGQLSEWAEERHAPGMLADVIGAVVVIAVGAFCAFATWNIVAAG